jgi:V/A-type H+-transporting ATPase subunit A
MVYLQQDAFDKVDSSMPRERQLESFKLLKEIVDQEFAFETTEETREVFTRLTGLYKNWNYAPRESPQYESLPAEIRELVAKHRTRPSAPSSNVA